MSCARRLCPLAYYLIELALPSYAFLAHLPSQVAAAAVLVAQYALSSAGWTPTLEHYSRQGAQELELPASRLLAVWHHAQSPSEHPGRAGRAGCGVVGPVQAVRVASHAASCGRPGGASRACARRLAGERDPGEVQGACLPLCGPAQAARAPGRVAVPACRPGHGRAHL